ncbi:hypothetical protein C8R47DRAFT_88794 [Mycena vitilis]|nr:hypothetical protein C8R47DRAFT_88794 [Mycena vitilis]
MTARNRRREYVGFRSSTGMYNFCEPRSARSRAGVASAAQNCSGALPTSTRRDTRACVGRPNVQTPDSSDVRTPSSRQVWHAGLRSHLDRSTVQRIGPVTADVVCVMPRWRQVGGAWLGGFGWGMERICRIRSCSQQGFGARYVYGSARPMESPCCDKDEDYDGRGRGARSSHGETRGDDDGEGQVEEQLVSILSEALGDSDGTQTACCPIRLLIGGDFL